MATWHTLLQVFAAVGVALVILVICAAFAHEDLPPKRR
jgi:hypothetical protein